MIKQAFLTSLFLGAFLIFPAHVSAARLYLLPLRAQVQQEKEFTAELRLDTQGVSINALDIRVQFPKDVLVFDSASDASSLVNIWIERPQLVSGTDGVITLSGVAPGGFTGDGRVTLLTFHGIANGDAVLAITPDSRVVLDGPDGELIFVVANDASFSVTDSAPVSEEGGVIESEIVPEVATALARSPNAYENRWFVSFVAQDKQSGIKEYQVQEKLLGIFKKPWQTTESPYVLEHQYLLSTITIQAITFDGEIGRATITPTRLKIIYGLALAIGFSGMLLFLLKLALKRLPRVA